MKEQRIAVPIEELRGTRLLDAFEIVWRIKLASVLELAGVAIARLVPIYDRGVLWVHSSEHLKNPTTLERLLRDNDVVVLRRGTPFAVILRPDEYERLVGRQTPTLDREE